MSSLELTRNSVVIPDLRLSGDFTFESWTFLTPRGNDPAGRGDSLLHGSTPNGENVSLNFNGTKLQFFAHSSEWSGNNVNPAGVKVAASTVAHAGEWHHYAVVREDGILKIYLDGALEATSAAAWNNNINVTNLGKGIGGSLLGRLDEVRIWNSARSQTDIESNMAYTVDPASADLLRYYSIEGRENTLQDATGNSDDVTLNGTTQALVAQNAGVATQVHISNPGFEATQIEENTQHPGDISGWHTRGEAGILRPTQLSFEGGAPEGDNVAYLDDRGHISQTLSERLIAGKDYILKVSVGDDYQDAGGSASSWQVQLYAGDTVLGRITDPNFRPGEGQFVEAELRLSAQDIQKKSLEAGILNQPLKIVLSDTGDSDGKIRFDDISLVHKSNYASTTESLSVGESVQIDFQANPGGINGGGIPVTAQMDMDGTGPNGNVWQGFSISSHAGQGYGETNPALSNLVDSNGGQTTVGLRVEGKIGAYNTKQGNYRPNDIASVVEDHHFVNLKGYSSGFETTEPAEYTFYNLQPGTYSYTTFINRTPHNPPREYEIEINGQGHTVNSEVTAGTPNPSNRLTVDDVTVGADGQLTVKYMAPTGANRGDPSPAGAVLTFVEADPNSPVAEQSSDEGGFQTQLMVPDMEAATDMAFLPDGKLLILQKNGTVLQMDNPDDPSSAPHPIMDISAQIFNSAERGLLAITVDPDFSNNSYFYLMHTKIIEGASGAKRTTVSRFTYHSDDEALMKASETVIWQENDDVSNHSHQGGGLAIGFNPSDGLSAEATADERPYKLFITTGEEFTTDNSPDLQHPDGKTHRIHLDGSIPSDNPYFDEAAANNYNPADGAGGAVHANRLMSVWSHGLRNPWRATYDDELQRLLVAEVGGNIDTSSTEDVHVAEKGANHGWSSRPSIGEFDSNDPGSAIHAYNHLNGPGQDGKVLPGANGGSITGGPVYRGEGKYAFPDEYQGAYFYGDWVRQWVRSFNITQNADGTLDKTPDSDQFFANTPGQPLSFKVGPEGALYILTSHRTGNVFTFDGRLYRVTYGNEEAPTGVGITIGEGQKQTEEGPHRVDFTADVEDPDGDDAALQYQWNFDHESIQGESLSAVTSTEKNPSYTYQNPGVYSVTLTVTDEDGVVTRFDTRTIRIGNAPEVTITQQGVDTSVPQQTFRAGTAVPFNASATDVEDGQLSSDSIAWGSELSHNTHSHPGGRGVLDSDGNTVFFIPDTGHGYIGNTFYSVKASALDSDGFQTVGSHNLKVERATVSLSAPTDEYQFERIGLGDLEIPKGELRITDATVGFKEVFMAQSTYSNADGRLHFFSHWADDPSNTNPLRIFEVPPGTTTLTPVYTLTNPETNTSLSESRSGKFVGSGGIDIPVVQIAENQDFTVEAWVNLSDPISNDDSLLFGDGALDLNFYGGQFRFYKGSDHLVASTSISADTWTHVAAVRENGILKIYMDGEEDAVGTSEWNGSFQINKIGSGTTGNLEGHIDDLRIWSVARSGDEIASNLGKLPDSMQTGLLRHYDFDRGEMLFDETGNTSAIALTDSIEKDASIISPNSGRAETSAFFYESRSGKFVGSGGIDIPVVQIAENQDFTVEAWVNLSDPISNDDSLLFGDGALDLNFYGGQFRFYKGSDHLVASTSISADTWTHVAAVRENGILKIYMDGEEDAVGTSEWNGSFQINKIGSGTTGNLEGHIDDLRIWSVARSGDEIASNLGKLPDSMQTGLLRHYDFDRGEMLFDETGNTSAIALTDSIEKDASMISPNSGRAEINYAPVAVPDYAETSEEQKVTVKVIDNDVDSITKSTDLKLVSAGSDDGEVSINSDKGQIIFTPNKAFSGLANISYVVEDGHGLRSSPGALRVLVGYENDAPVVNNEAIVVPYANERELNLLDNDSDEENASLSLVSAEAKYGSVTIRNNKAFYTPDAQHLEQQDVITYKVSDGTNETSGQATITVESPDYETQEDSYLVVPGLLPTPTAGSSTYFLAGSFSAQHGTVVALGGGHLYYTPDENYHGIDTITYQTIENSSIVSDPISVVVKVNSVNDNPEPKENIAVVVPYEKTIVIGNFITDPEGDDLTITSASSRNGESVSVDDAGNLVYSSAAYLSLREDIIDYTVSDGNGGTVTGGLKIVGMAGDVTSRAGLFWHEQRDSDGDAYLTPSPAWIAGSDAVSVEVHDTDQYLMGVSTTTDEIAPIFSA